MEVRRRVECASNVSAASGRGREADAVPAGERWRLGGGRFFLGAGVCSTSTGSAGPGSELDFGSTGELSRSDSPTSDRLRADRGAGSVAPPGGGWIRRPPASKGATWLALAAQTEEWGVARGRRSCPRPWRGFPLDEVEWGDVEVGRGVMVLEGRVGVAMVDEGKAEEGGVG